MRVQTFKSEQAWISAIIDSIKTINPKTIALSGGSTPEPIYKNFPKGAFKFFQVDERYVPHNHPDSNYKIIAETLGRPINYFDTSLPIAEALKNYAKKLPKQFDLCILGVGPDGHTASLFPDTPETDEPVAHTTTKQFAVHNRLTITFSTILKSKNLLVLLKNKPQIIEEFKKAKKSPEKFPALKLLAHPLLKIFALQS